MGATPRKFWNFNLVMVLFGGSSIPFLEELVGGLGATPRKFWKFNLKMVSFRGYSISFWEIKGFATGSKWIFAPAGANICSDLLHAHFWSKCLGANSEFCRVLQRYHWTTLIVPLKCNLFQIHGLDRKYVRYPCRQTRVISIKWVTLTENVSF